MSLKERISSPLEAGISILDAHHLPPHLYPSLEYISARLASKSLHVTLVVSRRDYQLPAVLPPLGSPGFSPITPATPLSTRFTFGASPITALKQLVRSSSHHRPSPARSTESIRSAVSSPVPLSATFESATTKLRWPLTPATPLSPPPMTPSASSTATDTTGQLSQASFGLRLVHAGDLSPRAEKALQLAIARAERKFNTGCEWLSPAVGPAACGLTKQLVQTSITQNEVLYSSEGLTLVSLDRLYSLKSALSSYSKTRSPMRLEDAVDELRRLVLANNGCSVAKSDLLRSYDWLSVSQAAVTDLDRMYRKAYGGPEQVGAISGVTKLSKPTVAEPIIRSDDGVDDIGNESEGMAEEIIVTMAIPAIRIGKPPSPKGPVLKLQTNFGAQPVSQPKETDEDGDRTARPSDEVAITFQPWNLSIDQVLSPVVLSPDCYSMKFGPTTPRGYEDISPVTRGEWGFLMVDNAAAGRTVPIETC